MTMPMSACPSPDGYTLSVNNIYSVEHVDWTAVAAMFAEVGWGQRDPDQIRSAFERSSHVMFIYEAGELVAFGRTMDDGCY
jgi:hypothetical protein